MSICRSLAFLLCLYFQHHTSTSCCAAKRVFKQFGSLLTRLSQMAALIRDAPIGQLIRFVTNNRVLQYPEERSDFQIPPEYGVSSRAHQASLSSSSSSQTETVTQEAKNDQPVEPAEDAPIEEPRILGTDLPALTTIPTSHSELEEGVKHSDMSELTSIKSQIERVGTIGALQSVHSRRELEQAFSASTIKRDPSRVIVPQRTSDGNILVDWYIEGDQENPQNWSFGKKAFVSTIIYAYTMAVYMGSSIITASSEGIMEEFGVGTEAASLTLALYTLAYGIGPLLFSPISELPSVGRNPPYV